VPNIESAAITSNKYRIFPPKEDPNVPGAIGLTGQANKIKQRLL
jgi:hypothetical protein